MTISEKMKLLMEHNGWDWPTVIKESIKAIPKEYVHSDGGIPTQHTMHGVDALLSKFGLALPEVDECDFCGYMDGRHSPTCKVNWDRVPKCYEL